MFKNVHSRKVCIGELSWNDFLNGVSWYFDSHSRTHNSATLAGWEGKNRIQVEFADLGKRFGTLSDAERDISSCLQIGGRLITAAIATTRTFACH